MFNSVKLLIKNCILFISFIVTRRFISLLPSIYNLSPQGDLFSPRHIFIPLIVITTLIYLGMISFLPGRLQNIKIIGFLGRTVFLTPLTLVTIGLYILACPSLFLSPFILLASLLIHLFAITCIYLCPRSEDQSRRLSEQSRRLLYRSSKSSLKSLFLGFFFFFLNCFISYVIILIIWWPLTSYHCDSLICC